MTQDIGHWTYPINFDPNQYIGFIYQITNKVTGKKYIGRKQLHSKQRKQVKLVSDPNRTKTQIKTKQSDWKTYTGSSRQLNEEIAALGKHKFIFEILSLHKSLSSLNYAEVYMLVTSNALTSYFRNGEPAFYNGMIPPVKTRPKPDQSNDTAYEETEAD